MSFYEILELLLEESSLMEAIVVFAAVALVYRLLFARRIRSIFDPMTYTLVLSAVSITLLLLMYRHGAVTLPKTAFVIACLALFYLGFLVTDRSHRMARRLTSPRDARAVPGISLMIMFAANFTLLAVTYSLFGIPLFLESRLAQFEGSGGLGVLGRLTTGLEFGSLVLALVALQHRKSSRWAHAIVALWIVSALLSGSKGALLSGLFAWYLARVYRSGTWHAVPRLPPVLIAAIPAVLAAPLFVLTVQGAAEGGGPLGVVQALAVRVAAEGDPYAYFLADDAIDRVARFDLIAPLRPVLAAFRLVSAESAPNPGYEIVREVMGIDSPSTGPNSRLAIYLLFFYGWGGILLAPVLGVVLGLARNRLIRATRASAMSFAITATLFFWISKLEVDPQVTIAGVFGLALALPVYGIARRAGRLKPWLGVAKPAAA